MRYKKHNNKRRREKYKLLREAGYNSRQALRIRDWTEPHFKSVMTILPEFILMVR